MHRSERRLFIFKRGRGIDDDEFARAHDVTVRVRRGRQSLRPHGKADEAGAKLDAPDGLAARVGDRQESFDQVVRDAVC